MANIRDIAKLTGYSVATISRVINNNPYVDEKKRQEILKVMAEVNYIPNRTAQVLSSGKTKNIGVIVPYVNHPYFDQLISGIMTTAFDYGYQITLLPTKYDPETEKKYLQQLAAKSFDGLILTSRANKLVDIFPYLDYGRIVFCEDIPELTDGCTFINRIDSLTEALNYLKAQGVRNPGVTLGRSRTLSYSSKITVQLCHEIFEDFSEENIFWNSLTIEDGKEAVPFFKERQVDGIFTNGDLVAAGIRMLMPEMELLIGRENLFISDVLNISTIDHHLIECGSTAFELAIQAKKGVYSMPYEFILRSNQ
ncbi:LacI family DNA-binding transcriptional regulator [Enterococcus sp. HY326]|uniref:LacI family DNA-binding transcriptional regulator n=1 Tax=Enterococcus sp. HY326 TaxID=2971265 RepID=UPI00223FB1DE|nr:LacI family DNA-binding transcriptional regulator [Enterococcus sp. HY326]